MGLAGGKGGGGKNTLASKPNLLNALRVQTSSYGQVIPIVYGQNRLSGRLLWSSDFTAIAHTSTQKVGGKGLGSGGGNTITNTTYTYQTAVAIALCLGPIQNIHNVWDTKGRLTLLTTSEQFTVPGGGGSYTPPAGRNFHSGRGVSRADSFSVTNNDFGSDGSVTLSGTTQNPMALVGSSPGAGQYTLNTSTGVHTFAAADAGKVMTITYSYSFPDSNSNGQPQQKLNLTLFLGSRPQTAWSYLTSAHPGKNLGYNGVAYVASSAMDLGESGTLPNLSFEVLGILPFGAGITDAEPSAIINDLLSNQFYGMNGAVPLDAATLTNNSSSYRNFCIANGLFLSPVLDSQRACRDWIQEILDVTNAAAVWSEGVLKVVSYGDTTAVNYGATFIPNTQPIYDLTTNDFLSPVTVKRPSVADVMNATSVEFVNRANDYNIEVAEDKDEAMIAVYGLRKASQKTAHSITTTTVAKFVANLQRKREVEIRATYVLKLGWQFNLLEPMDLVTITVPELGYSKKPVRITAIREDESGQLEMEAEDFPWGTATPTLYAQQSAGGFISQANADPGSVATPIIFEANDRISLTGNYEVWMGACPNPLSITAASNATPIQITASSHGFHTGQNVVVAGVGGNTAANGNWKITVVDQNNFTLDNSIGNGAYTSGGQVVNADWGGCRVWASPDNSNYAQVGTIYGPSRMGVLTAQLVSSADPDTTHTLSVNLTESVGQLSGGSQDDCDNFRTLCYVDGELISYQGATLTSSYNYNLATRLRRGVFGSLIGTHNVGSVFLRLDNAVFVWEADPTLVGLAIGITGATNASPIQITAPSHNLATGRSVVITGVGGNTAANGTWVITKVDANNFTLNGSTGNGAYTSGGLETPIIFFKFTSFNKFGLMEQSLANAAGYGFGFLGLFGNAGETPANNATVDSVFVSGTNDSIRVYGPSGVGNPYTVWKQKDQTFTRSIAAHTITTVEETGSSPQVTTPYWVSYDFAAATHRAWRNYNNYVQAIYRGQMRLGLVQTVNSSGTGGTSGGLGDSGSGGSGGGGHVLPQQ